MSSSSADPRPATTPILDQTPPPPDAEGHGAEPTTVAVVTLGCARNEVDSEELAARLEAGGFRLVDDPEAAGAVLVNTCGFIEQAKKDSVDALLAAAELKGSGTTKAVVAVGCMAERYGRELAAELPEADAVLGFDDYADVADRLQSIMGGHQHTSHVPRDRRALLPLTPVQRAAASAPSVPGHGQPAGVDAPDLPAGVAPASGPRALRRRLGSGPSAPLKIASGCDRRCAFCAIPSFRGAFLSRPPADVLVEAEWLTANGVRELFLVSENTTSYGKDLGDLRSLEALLPQLADLPARPWVRVSYLQPAEMRPSLVQAIAATPGVVPYFDLSFQHASGPVLRRMRRFGDERRFLDLIESIRAVDPAAGIRTNVIVGFPGETDADVDVLCEFLGQARLDAVGVFGYSDEDGTEGARLADKVDPDEVLERVERVQDLVDELVVQRAEERLGETVHVLVESVGRSDAGGDLGGVDGRAWHQGPDVDGCTRLVGADTAAVGDLVTATVIDTDGVDLIARVG